MAAPQQGGQSDNSAGILWGVAALFAAIGIIWYVFKLQIAGLYLSVKLAELDFITYLFSLFHFDTTYFEQLRQNIQIVKSQPSSITFENMVLVGNIIGRWLRIPFAVLLFMLGIIVYMGNTASVFKRIYKMREFAKLERQNWPQITPVVGLDLIKVDIDKGPWAMAMSPMQFCKRYKLLQEVKPQRREGMARHEWDKIEVILKRGEANQIFALQLGQLWQGPERLPPYAKALFAIFAARINADSQAAAKIILQLANSSTSSSMDCSGVDALLKKHINSKIVQQVMKSHAYVLTVMASMLERARDDGVQASADFLWLKPVDRRLWYTLNVVGRQTPFIEVAGVFAHWVAEKRAGRKLFVPMIEEATNAVEIALKEVVYRPEE